MALADCGMTGWFRSVLECRVVGLSRLMQRLRSKFAPRVPGTGRACFPCACCGSLTVEEPGDYELCPVCFWEDDPDQKQDSAFESGANGYSLDFAKSSYAATGSSHPLYRFRVRRPLPSELPH